MLEHFVCSLLAQESIIPKMELANRGPQVDTGLFGDWTLRISGYWLAARSVLEDCNSAMLTVWIRWSLVMTNSSLALGRNWA